MTTPALGHSLPKHRHAGIVRFPHFAPETGPSLHGPPNSLVPNRRPEFPLLSPCRRQCAARMVPAAQVDSHPEIGIYSINVFYILNRGVYAMPRGYGLTFRQERFCHAYLRCANAAQAAAEAGYSEHSARNQAYRLLQTGRIRNRLADIQEENALQACSGLYVMLAKLQNVYERAIEARHFYAAARAVEIQSRLLGQRGWPPALPPARRPAAVLPPVPAPASLPEEDISDIAPWLTGAKKW